MSIQFFTNLFNRLILPLVLSSWYSKFFIILHYANVNNLRRSENKQPCKFPTPGTRDGHWASVCGVQGWRTAAFPGHAAVVQWHQLLHQEHMDSCTQEERYVESLWWFHVGCCQGAVVQQLRAVFWWWAAHGCEVHGVSEARNWQTAGSLAGPDCPGFMH